ncbi:phosphodiester glycosidase family protein [Candidatus Peregrinibacteria bacterium]|nr:phosphodiester glycosidase family protein [Candidatus Peregrinibacteria bacterium]
MKKIYAGLCIAFLSAFLLTACTPETPIKPVPKPPQEEQKKLNWKEVEKGLSYSSLSETTQAGEEKDLILVKIDPKLFSFHIYQNTSIDTAKTIQEVHTETGAVLTFNGGFFTEDFKPTGLLLENGEIFRKTSPADLLNGIFSIKNDGTPQLLEQDIRINKGNFYTFAIQNGPVLIDKNGSIKINSDTGKLANRTAMGIDKDGNIVLIVLKLSLLNPDNTISLYEFAQLLKNNDALRPLYLHSVLNLDGGPSTGMMINESYYPEMERVQNIIYVKRST